MTVADSPSFALFCVTPLMRLVAASDVVGAQACKPCSDIGSYLLTLNDSATSASMCLCAAGYYSLDVISQDTQNPCLPCDPFTMDCEPDQSGGLDHSI